MIRGSNQGMKINAQLGEKFTKGQTVVPQSTAFTPQTNVGHTPSNNSLNLTLPPKNNLPITSTPHGMSSNSYGTPGILSAVGGGGVGGINTIEQNFALTLQTPIQSGSSILWSYNIPPLSANEKSLLLDITGGQILILQAADADFPQQLCIYCDQLSGYLNNEGTPTHIIGIYRIAQILVTNVGGITAYTILYTLKDPQSWPMGINRVIQLSVGDFDAPFIPPLTSPVNLELKIHHVSY